MGYVPPKPPVARRKEVGYNGPPPKGTIKPQHLPPSPPRLVRSQYKQIRCEYCGRRLDGSSECKSCGAPADSAG